jgi:protein-L-isoaspartate(D-aspartate) O-methyltransferase
MGARRLAWLSVVVAVLTMAAAASCDEREETVAPVLAEQPPAPNAPSAREDDDARYAPLRARMVASQIAGRDVTDRRVLDAMRRVPRHLFVPARYRGSAYTDQPLPIGYDQTISQPYIVGIMSELAEVEPGDKVLEIGTGSGYQAAVLAEMGCEVYTIEIVAPLGRSAAALLARLGYDRVHTRIGDGYRGWPEHAPFDAVILTAAPPRIPEPLKEQTKVGGNLVAPVGVSYQELVVLHRMERGFSQRSVFPVAFVPMTGEAQGE